MDDFSPMLTVCVARNAHADSCCKTEQCPAVTSPPSPPPPPSSPPRRHHHATCRGQVCVTDSTMTCPRLTKVQSPWPYRVAKLVHGHLHRSTVDCTRPYARGIALKGQHFIRALSLSPHLQTPSPLLPVPNKPHGFCGRQAPRLLRAHESRRESEEGGELDFHEEASPEEIKRREVVLGWRVGLLLLQLLPNSGATDIVTLFCTAVGTPNAWCWGRCAMPDGRCLNILLFWRRSTAASVFRVGACV